MSENVTVHGVKADEEKKSVGPEDDRGLIMEHDSQFIVTGHESWDLKVDFHSGDDSFPSDWDQNQFTELLLTIECQDENEAKGFNTARNVSVQAFLLDIQNTDHRALVSSDIELLE